MSLLISGARIVPGDGSREPYLGCVRLAGDLIAEIGPELPVAPGEELLVASGRVLLPGFVDAHTHAAYAGNRLDEFELKRQGKSYLEILSAGGGILSSVRATRQASEDELVRLLAERLEVFLEQGTTTVEIKSGYGLRTADELKLLRAIRRAAQDFEGSVVPTALLGHAIDPDVPNFVESVIQETLPAVHAEFPEITVDAYCESGAWSVSDCRRLLERALELNHPVRLHTDQFTALGGLPLAIELGACSADHLEATAPADLARLAQSSCYGVMLPASGFHTDDRYGLARAFLDAGGKLVLATNYNPGSAPCSSMPFVIALAVRKLALSALEALRACTDSAARLLGFGDRGRIAVGARADLVLLRHEDERSLGYEVGGNPVSHVIVAGRLRRGSGREAPGSGLRT
jgi:imidazolonepropionase